jgi:hypothetical protein
MVQNIIIIGVLVFTVGYIVYSVYKSLSEKNKSTCDDCAGCEVKKEMLKNVKNQTLPRDFECGSHRTK